MKKIALRLIRLYQLFLSPILGTGKCRFHPVCSVYGKLAIKEHGLIKGCVLIIWRILRCNPLCIGGIDPVPHHFNNKKVNK
ncbi:membrane protein insertion efficiency factor YidD [Psittacicella melopsittaci]|uniref:Putative membrane protein insertion efficiency factor n=1 Tax=Psittacicella melopsittaci TaxID=2028576 RepID=A0A3A1Y0K1_9GAMM|nr:membrane protein insertion efficiency factor YidD [Psittacicella melopsittaci]